MDNQKIANELVDMAERIAGTRSAGSTKAQALRLLEDIKYVQILGAEAQFSEYEGKRFRSIKEISKFVAGFPDPEFGYDKVYVNIEFKDGTNIGSFRYDHGGRDSSFSKQLVGYIMNQITFD